MTDNRISEGEETESVQGAEQVAVEAPAGKQKGTQKQKHKMPPEIRYFDRLLGKRVKITPMAAGLPPITGTLKSYSIYELEIELQNRTVVVFKHAIYTIEEAPEPIIAPKRK